MNETTAPAIEQPAPTTTSIVEVPATAVVATPAEYEGDFATGERTGHLEGEAEHHEGDFAAGERTAPEVPDPATEHHGDFAAGERTEPTEDVDDAEGSFADTNT